MILENIIDRDTNSLKINLVNTLTPDENKVSGVKDPLEYALIKTATTTTVFTGAGVLGSLKCLGGTNGTVAVYDNTAGSGTEVIPSITLDVTNKNNLIPKPIEVGTGLTIVTGSAIYLLVGYRTLPLV
jgi:hypothetical protein